jgi:alkanesulfonate monooxygenase SsuD/methylene tetrahydromethanopterin reductase-like flavin-dependent oxidoreductase (luciferase family)
MRFGLFTGTTGIAWSQLQSLWQHLEATGWDTACVTDHFMPNTRNPIDDTLECWTALSGLALSTQRLRIGTLVVGIPIAIPPSSQNGGDSGHHVRWTSHLWYSGPAQ